MQRRAQSCVDRPCYLWRTFSPLQLAAHSAFQGCVCRCGFHVLRRGSRLKPVSVGHPSQVRQLELEISLLFLRRNLAKPQQLISATCPRIEIALFGMSVALQTMHSAELNVTTVRRILMSRNLPRQNRQGFVAETIVRYRTVDVGGNKIFYREAGRKDAPALLLLHGYPTASHLFRDLIQLLADRFRLVAPDLPGFGQSDMPSRTSFTYTWREALAAPFTEDDSDQYRCRV